MTPQDQEGITEATFARNIGPPWTALSSVRVGAVPAGEGTPDAYVLVSVGGVPRGRIDIYVDETADASPFHDVTVWHHWIVVGIGSHVLLVERDGGGSRSFNLGGYFGQLYSTPEWLLVASSECLVGISTDGVVRWSSPTLGIDGVIMNRVEGDVIYGEGEWDPPGGWKPFKVSLSSGQVVS